MTIVCGVGSLFQWSFGDFQWSMTGPLKSENQLECLGFIIDAIYIKHGAGQRIMASLYIYRHKNIGWWLSNDATILLNKTLIQ